MILVVDNRDSFTFNLVQALQGAGRPVEVESSRTLGPDDCLRRGPRGVLIGPGPGTPRTAGRTLELVRGLRGRVPLLGVCLGHQALAVALGGRLVRARRMVHGRTVAVHHDGAGCFAGLASPTEFAVYNSLVVDPATLPADLQVSARSGDGEIMGLRDRTADAEGVQFHPESFLSREGERLLSSWLARCDARPSPSPRSAGRQR